MNKLSQNQVSVEFYIKKMHDSFTEDVAFRYPDEESYGSEYDYIESITKDYLQKEKNYIAPEIMMTRLRSWYFDNAYYQLVKQKDSEKALEYYAKSSYYGFLAIYINYSAIKCQFPYRMNYYSYSLVTAYLSQCLIAGYDKEFSEILELFYASIKYKNLSREEYVNQHNTIYLDFDTDRFGVVWFLYRLFYKTKETDIQIETEYKLDNFYQQVIDNWDTQDLMKVDKLVYMLSEVHIDQTREDTPEEQLNNPFNNPLYWLFPYEILVWLKLRKLKGFENPKAFSHPLMNTPIAKFFLSLETPLPKPSTLPFAKELLSKLKEQCPNVEIPEWLETMLSSHEILPEDFMS